MEGWGLYRAASRLAQTYILPVAHATWYMRLLCDLQFEGETMSEFMDRVYGCCLFVCPTAKGETRDQVQNIKN